jgi:hypothetical protein
VDGWVDVRRDEETGDGDGMVWQCRYPGIGDRVGRKGDWGPGWGVI